MKTQSIFFVLAIALFTFTSASAQACKKTTLGDEMDRINVVLDFISNKSSGFVAKDIKAIYPTSDSVVIETLDGKGVCTSRVFQSKNTPDCKVEDIKMASSGPCKT